MHPEITAEMWARRDEPRVRDYLIEAHLPLVNMTRKRAIPAVPWQIDAADLDAEGMVALISAVDRFDPARGTEFQTYAIAKIRGALQDYLRREDWAPRSLRQKQRLLAGIERTGVVPEGVDLERLQAEAHEVHVISLQVVTCEGETDESGMLTLADTLADPHANPEALCIEQERQERLNHLLWQEVRYSGRREALALTLQYEVGLSYSQIAARLKVSPSRANQLLRSGLRHLRTHLDLYLPQAVLP